MKYLLLSVSGLKSDIFVHEFDDIKAMPEPHHAAFTEANRPYNFRKNRYNNVLPLDQSRVRLQGNGVPGSDYINANYVDGWKTPHVWIATQAPVPSSMEEFWRMVCYKKQRQLGRGRRI